MRVALVGAARVMHADRVAHSSQLALGPRDAGATFSRIAGESPALRDFAGVRFGRVDLFLLFERNG
jgi:hypothetical protein